MFRISAILLSACFLSLFFVSCSGVCGVSGHIYLDMDNTTAECREGDIIVIRLDSNPSTGYDWTPASYNSSVLKITGRVFLKDDSLMQEAQNMLGAYTFDFGNSLGGGGVTEISFSAENPGESEVKLEYSRPWEGKATKEAVFKIKVLDDID